MLAAEELARAIAGEVLDDVGVLAAAIVAPPGVALGVFIGEDRAGCLQYRFGDKVLTGNHLQPLVLAESFLVKGGGDLGVNLGEGKRHAVRHNWNFSLFSLVETVRSTQPEVQIPYTESGTDISEDLVISRHCQLAWILICTFALQLVTAQD